MFTRRTCAFAPTQQDKMSPIEIEWQLCPNRRISSNSKKCAATSTRYSWATRVALQVHPNRTSNFSNAIKPNFYEHPIWSHSGAHSWSAHRYGSAPLVCKLHYTILYMCIAYLSTCSHLSHSHSSGNYTIPYVYARIAPAVDACTGKTLICNIKVRFLWPNVLMILLRFWVQFIITIICSIYLLLFFFSPDSLSPCADLLLMLVMVECIECFNLTNLMCSPLVVYASANTHIHDL